MYGLLIVSGAFATGMVLARLVIAYLSVNGMTRIFDKPIKDD